jgi:hypothetical protein
MTFMIMLFSFITILFEARAQECGLAEPSWYACKKDEDCIVDLSVCGQIAAYAKIDIEEIREHHRCVAPNISCVQPPKNLDLSKAKVICKDKKCALKK